MPKSEKKPFMAGTIGAQGRAVKPVLPKITWQAASFRYKSGRDQRILTFLRYRGRAADRAEL